jgi:hypothetical protein
MTTTTTPKKTQDLQVALRQAAATLAEQLSDATSLKVDTLYVKVGDDGSYEFKDARPVASTTIELDGDTTMVIPLRDENGVLVRDDALLEVHLDSVKNAIEYRQKLLEALFNLVRQPRER